MVRTMNGKRVLSVKTRLLILLVVMILPFIFFSTYKAIEINDHLEQAAREEGLRIAQATAHTIDEYIISTGDALIPIAESDAARNQDYVAVKQLLERVLVKYPYYNILVNVDLNGDIKAVAMTAAAAKSEDAKVVNARNLVCYTRGITTNGVAVGDFMYSKLTKRPVVHIVYPVFDPTGKRLGFIAAAFDLRKLQEKIVGPEIPSHMDVGAISDKGIVMARNRDPQRFVGKDVSKQPQFRYMFGKSQGTNKLADSSGEVKIFGFAQTTLAPWYVKACVDTDYIQQEVRSQLTNHFMVFIPLLLLTIIGWLWIGRDVNELHNQAERLALIDPLTSLWNARKLNQDFDRELSSAKRHRDELSFLMLDIDYFKLYNDQNGHQAGDRALQAISKAIANSVREHDAVYRYGGEELCVILPRTGFGGAAEIAERIRAAIEQAVFEGEDKQPGGELTISIGMATYPYDAVSKAMLIKCADKALYHAKALGKNRVEAHSILLETAENSDLAG